MPEIAESHEVKVPEGGFGSELFWRVLAVVIFLSVIWILWLLWQITPRSNVNPIVFQINQSRQSTSGVIQGSGNAGPGTAGEAPLSTGAPMDNLKIETELKSPVKPAATSP